MKNKSWKYNPKKGLYNGLWKWECDLFGVLWRNVGLNVYSNAKTGEWKIREENPFAIEDPWELEEKIFPSEAALDSFIEKHTDHLEITYGNANAALCIMNALSTRESYDYDFGNFEY